MSLTFGQRECWCGKPWSPTPDGRWLHRTLFAHTPSDPAPEPEPVLALSHHCRRDDHNLCGGGLIHNGQIATCRCWCHEQMGVA